MFIGILYWNHFFCEWVKSHMQFCIKFAKLYEVIYLVHCPCQSKEQSWPVIMWQWSDKLSCLLIVLLCIYLACMLEKCLILLFIFIYWVRVQEYTHSKHESTAAAVCLLLCRCRCRWQYPGGDQLRAGAGAPGGHHRPQDWHYHLLLLLHQHPLCQAPSGGPQVRQYIVQVPYLLNILPSSIL